MAEGAADNGSGCLETDVTGMFINCSRLAFLISAGDGLISLVSAARLPASRPRVSMAAAPAVCQKLPRLSFVLVLVLVIVPSPVPTSSMFDVRRSMFDVRRSMFDVHCCRLAVRPLP